jgi:hypothetical protein
MRISNLIMLNNIGPMPLSLEDPLGYGTQDALAPRNIGCPVADGFHFGHCIGRATG